MRADTVSLERKSRELERILGDMRSVLVGFSGGVDSTFLLAAAKEALGDGVLAAIGESETYPERERSQAVRIAESLGVRYVVVRTSELAIPGFSSNPPDRCYHCKRELFARLNELADEHGIMQVVDGSNADDVHDYRPGMTALRELGVRSPLREAGLGKSEIRRLSREMGLPTWDKPATACLASRFPYGTVIDERTLSMVERAEEALLETGFQQFRVRHHGPVARIEVAPDEIGRLASAPVRERITRAMKEIGYTYVALDLEGYRTGSMNEALERRDP